MNPIEEEIIVLTIYIKRLKKEIEEIESKIAARQKFIVISKQLISKFVPDGIKENGEFYYE